MEKKEDLQSLIIQFQQLQEQFESVATTRTQMELQLRETENAYQEVEKIDEKAPLYKAVGGLMVRAKSKMDVLKELVEKKESLQVRVESLKKQEKSIEEMLKKLSTEIQEKIRMSQIGGEQGPMAG